MRKRKGFTLVELMIVIAIIATLATVSVIGYRTFVRRETINASVTEADQSAQVIISQVASSNEGAIILRNKTTGDKLVNFGDIEFTYLNGNLQINSEIPDGKTNTIESIKEFDEALRYYFPSIMSLPGTFTMDTGVIYYHHLSIDEIEELFNKPNYNPDDHLEDGVGYDNDKYIYDKENPSTPYNVNDVAIDILSLDFMTIEESGNASGIESDGIKFSLTQSTILLKTNEDPKPIGYTYSGSDTPLSVEKNVKYDSKYLEITMDESNFYLKGKRVTKQPIYVYFTVGRITKTLKVKITESGRTIIDLPKLMNTITWQSDHIWNATGTGSVSGKTYHKLEWDYGNGNGIATLVSCQEGEEPNTYTATFTIVDPDPEDDIEYCWADNFSYGTKVVKWRINKISIPEPIQVIYKDFDDMEYSDETIDLTTHTPDWDSVTANYIKNGVLSYTTARDDSKILLQTKKNKQGEKHGAWQDPGEYDANFKIEKPAYYQWADSVNVYKTVKWHVFKKQIDKPELIDSNLPYTFKRDTSVSDSVQGITYKLYEIEIEYNSRGKEVSRETVYDKYFSHINSKIDLTGDLEASNAGEYTVKVSINRPGEYEWKTPSSEYKKVAGQDYYERKWNIALSNDYTLTWRILPAEVPIPQKSDLRIDFNGEAHTETIKKYYNPEGYEDVLEVKIENPNAINVGDYTANIHIKNSNYCWKVTDKTTGIVDNADKEYKYHIDPVTISIPTLVDSDKYTFSYDKSTLEYKAVDVKAKLSNATVNGSNGTNESLTYDKYVDKYIKVKDGTSKKAGTKDIVLSLNNPANATQYNVKWSEGDTEIKKLEDKTISWTINPAEIDVSKLGITQINIPTYSGSSITPQFNNVPNILKTNASSINASDNLTASFTVKDDFKDNFVIKESTNSVNWKIKKKEITPSVVTVEGGYTYNGNPITPDVTFDSIVEKDKPFVKGTDYTLSYANNINANDNTGSTKTTVTVSLTNSTKASNYTLSQNGAKPIEFIIKKAIASYTRPTVKTGLVYNGSNQELINPATNVTGGTVEYAVTKGLSGEKTFSSSIPTAKEAGTYYVWSRLNGSTNYYDITASVLDKNGEQMIVTISQYDLSNATISSISDKNYTGSPITPTPTVTALGKNLVSGTDFTCDYSNNTNAGTATVTVNGIGNFKGSKSTTFAILQKEITVTANNQTMVYGENSPSSKTYSADGLYSGDTIGTPTYSYSKDGENVTVNSFTKVGTYTVTISDVSNSNYKITCKPGTLTITQREIEPYIDSSYSAEYDGNEKKPSISFKNVPANHSLTLGDDYTVTYTNNVDAAESTATKAPTATVALTTSTTAKNYKLKSTTIKFTISKASSRIVSVPTARTNLQFTGEAQNLVNAGTASNGAHLEYAIGTYPSAPTSGWSEDVPKATNKGTYDVCYRLVGDGNHLNGSGYGWIQGITIGSKSISGATVTGLESKTYTGSAITQTITVKVNDITLTNGTDYTVGFANNTNVGEAKVTITGKGNYEGTVEKTFEINKKSITLKATDTEMVYGGSPSISYSKDAIAEKDRNSFGTLSYQAYDKDGVKVGTDGHISSTTPVGEYSIEISGLSNDNYNITFGVGKLTIKPKAIIATPSAKSLDYSNDGTYNLSFTFKDEKNLPMSFEQGDYEVVFPEEVKAGKINVSVEFNSDKAKNYTVSPNSFEITINKIKASYISQPSAKTLSYKGSPQELINAAQAKGTVYYCAVQTNNGYGEYSGISTRDVDFNTFANNWANAQNDSWSNSSNAKFSGSKGDIGYILCFINDRNNYGFIKVEHISKSGSKVYTNNKGYEMFGTTIPTATNPGNYKVYYWLGGDTNHTDYDTPSASWTPNIIEVTISPANISNATISAIDDQTYNGNEIKPEPDVEMGNTPLKKDTDYTISYSNNINAEEATITITGIGNYTGTKTTKFNINKANLANAEIESIVTQNHTGSKIKPTPKVTINGLELKAGTDFNYEYGDNIEGTGTVTIRATGNNCEGYKTVEFQIKQKQVSQVKVRANETDGYNNNISFTFADNGSHTFYIENPSGGVLTAVSNDTNHFVVTTEAISNNTLQVTAQNRDDSNYNATITITSAETSDYQQSQCTISVTLEKGCFTENTLITLCDGSQKMIKDMDGSEILSVWDFDQGKYVEAPIFSITKSEESVYETIKLTFSDGTKIDIIQEHGLFDKTVNKFVNISKSNVEECLNHSFVKRDGDYFTVIELVDYEIVNELHTSCCITSVSHLNVIANNLFTINPGMYFLLPYEIDESLKYDEIRKAADIEKYGLLTYEELKVMLPSVTEKLFNAAAAYNIKVAIGKEIITMEGIMNLASNIANDQGILAW